MKKPSQKIKELNLVIPKAPEPVGSYAAFVRTGNLIFISGQLPIDSSGKITKGKIGDQLNIDQGQDAAYLCALNIIAQITKALEGDIDKVSKCIKLTGYVNSVDDFIEQPNIINKASNLITNIFGDYNMHCRAAISSNSLPLGAAVEIDAIFEISQ
tara:strand:- start:886 stop:1353 length:468 start_codon:yes stop_codon:yes gene_type:complete